MSEALATTSMTRATTTIPYLLCTCNVIHDACNEDCRLQPTTTSPHSFGMCMNLIRCMNLHSYRSNPISPCIVIHRLHDTHSSFRNIYIPAILEVNMAALDLIPPVLNSKSEPPPLFDGTTRLYISVTCPYAQRVWSARNIKGLSEIQIVPIDLQDRPAWYKEKVYPPNKVPSLEHNGKIIGESLDLLEYLENNFEGPKLFPTDPAKKEAANELLKYTDTFTKSLFIGLTKPEPEVAQEAGPALDYLENALGKFADGPFFLGEFSVVDIAYGPFVERFQIVYPALKNNDITSDRPKLLKWIQELHKIDAYAKTKVDPETIVETYKRILANYAK